MEPHQGNNSGRHEKMIKCNQCKQKNLETKRANIDTRKKLKTKKYMLQNQQDHG